MTIRPIEGAVVLPWDLMVKMDALGTSLNGSVECGGFEILLPRYSPSSDAEAAAPGSLPKGVDLASPDPNNGRLAGGLIADGPFSERWGGVCIWTPPTATEVSRPLAADVHAFGLRAEVSDPVGVIDAELADRFGRQFKTWYRLLIEWVEVWTSQLVHRHWQRPPIPRGSVWDLSADPPTLTGFGGVSGPIFFQGSDVAATFSHLQAAAKQATAKNQLPAEWTALMTAKRATQSRLAVIEAGTAAEMALASAIERRLPNMTPDGVTTVIKNANGVAGLVKLLDAMQGRPPGNRSRVFALLAKPRNLAVHSGEVPSRDVADKAITTATALLEEFSPLPAVDNLGHEADSQ